MLVSASPDETEADAGSDGSWDRNSPSAPASPLFFRKPEQRPAAHAQ